MSCEFAHYDGAYVLGALAPAERLLFERHLPGCAECSRSVQELAGLTGLLARVSPDVLESPPLDEPVPQTLLPTLLREVRRAQRRRTWVTAGLAAAAALVVTIGTLGLTGAFEPDHTTSSAPPNSTVSQSSRPMVPLDTETIWGDLAMTSVAWGTRLDLTCGYAADDETWGWSAGSTYALVIRSQDGAVEQVATWQGLPGKTVRITAATATTRDDIASVEVRTADGTPVLKLVT